MTECSGTSCISFGELLCFKNSAVLSSFHFTLNYVFPDSWKWLHALVTRQNIPSHLCGKKSPPVYYNFGCVLSKNHVQIFPFFSTLHSQKQLKKEELPDTTFLSKQKQPKAFHTRPFNEWRLEFPGNNECSSMVKNRTSFLIYWANTLSLSFICGALWRPL